MTPSSSYAARESGCGSRPVAVAGTGCYLPERVLTNAELERMVDTTDHWILSRTGIRERRLAAREQATSDLAAEAARAALAAAGVAAPEVDLILVATLTPDMLFPNTACFVQALIGADRAACMGLEAACSGFLYALETGRHFVAAGAADTVLVVGAEKMSAILDWQDRTTCVLFGDGAGAVVLRPGTNGGLVRGTVMGAQGTLAGLLQMPAGGSRLPASADTLAGRQHFLKMQGREVFKHAVVKMSRAVEEVLESCGLGPDQIACVIPHQANQRIIRAVGQRTGIPVDRFFMNLERYGNTSSASIAIGLDEAVRAGRIRKGDLALLCTFGGGFTWGAMVLEWNR